MTRIEFEKVLIRLNPNNEAVINDSGTSLAMVCTYTAAHLYLHGEGSVSDHAELKRQLRSLEKTGYFDFDSPVGAA